MTIIVCDLCRRELAPRGKGRYDWVSKGGIVALVGEPGNARPARLYHGNTPVSECCTACAAKCRARVFVRPDGSVLT